jgi:hypothetical protein
MHLSKDLFREGLSAGLSLSIMLILRDRMKGERDLGEGTYKT